MYNSQCSVRVRKKFEPPNLKRQCKEGELCFLLVTCHQMICAVYSVVLILLFQLQCDVLEPFPQSLSYCYCVGSLPQVAIYHSHCSISSCSFASFIAICVAGRLGGRKRGWRIKSCTACLAVRGLNPGPITC